MNVDTPRVVAELDDWAMALKLAISYSVVVPGSLPGGTMPIRGSPGDMGAPSTVPVLGWIVSGATGWGGAGGAVFAPFETGASGNG